jgi:hypothetical protein
MFSESRESFSNSIDVKEVVACQYRAVSAKSERIDRSVFVDVLFCIDLVVFLPAISTHGRRIFFIHRTFSHVVDV